MVKEVTSGQNVVSEIFDGSTYHEPAPWVQFWTGKGDGIYLYFDAKTERIVTSGEYWTGPSGGQLDFPTGKLYGTNTDPSTFTDAADPANYTVICDLTRHEG